MAKLSLKTNSHNDDMPKKVAQRKYESTGEFMRRLDRMVAKAKAEANINDRFDLDPVINKRTTTKPTQADSPTPSKHTRDTKAKTQPQRAPNKIKKRSSRYKYSNRLDDVGKPKKGRRKGKRRR